MSTSSPNTLDGSIGSAPGNPATVLCCSVHAIRAVMSSPLALYTPPFQSVTATMVAPIFWSRSADTDPTLPKPWTATVAPLMGKPRCAAASRAVIMTPRPVASRRPSDPPISTGLPVTTAVHVEPTCMLYVSITHAIVWALVLTSGAGTSLSGPMASAISAM